MASTIASVTGSASTMTMSTKEIAELTGKEHKNVLYDTRCMFLQLGLASADFSANLPDSYGRMQQVYRLPKDLTLTLVAGYSTPLRHRFVTRPARASLDGPGAGRNLSPEKSPGDCSARLLR